MSSQAVWTHPLDRTAKLDLELLTASGDVTVASKKLMPTPWEREQGLTYNPVLGIPEEDKPWYQAPDPEWVERFSIEARFKAIRATFGNFYCALVEIPVGMLTAASFQRTPDDDKGRKLLQKMRHGFDPDIFGVVEVNFRHRDEDGLPVFSIMDGRGRATWVMRTYGPEATIPAVLYFDVPRYTENKFYDAQASEHSRKLTLVDLLRSRIDAGDPDTIAMLGILDDLGLTIQLDGAKGQDGGNNVTALDQITAIYRRENGSELLRETLAVLYEAFGESPNTFTTNMVGGVSEFLRLYSGLVQYDRKWLTKTLKSFKSPKEVESIAFALQGGRSRVTTVGAAIVKQYNFRKHEENTLPSWDAAIETDKQKRREAKRALKVAKQQERAQQREADRLAKRTLAQSRRRPQAVATA